MASVVDICNLALAHLGDSATVSAISPSDGSAQADHCARFYPIARDALLEMYVWNFATKRSVLAETATVTPPGGWGYEYAMPSNVLRPLALLPDEGSPDDAVSDRYVVEVDETSGNKIILTDTENAVLRYTYSITDTTKFSPLFVNALSWLLASYLAGPITKDARVKESMYKMFLVEVGRAGMSNANMSNNDAVHTPSWVSQRGYTSPYLEDGRIIR